MPFLFFALIALLGAAVHRHRDDQPGSTARSLEIFLVWWMVVAVGIAAIRPSRSATSAAPTATCTKPRSTTTTPDNTGLTLWADFVAPLG